MFRKLIATTDDYIPTILRIVLGVVMFAHGSQKVLGWFGGHGASATLGMFTGMGIPAPLAVLVMAAEFLGGLGLIFGFLGRAGAFGIACVMIGAIALVHGKNGFFLPGGFEYHLVVLSVCAAILYRGSGAFSVDRALARDDAEAPTGRIRRAA